MGNYMHFNQCLLQIIVLKYEKMIDDPNLSTLKKCYPNPTEVFH